MAIVLLACTSPVPPSAEPTAPASASSTARSTAAPTATPAATPTAAPTVTAAPPIACSDPIADGTVVVYRDAGDLWLYDAVTDASRRVTGDGEARDEWAPAFVQAGCVVHAAAGADSGSTIELLDLSPGGASRTLVTERGSIRMLAPSPDGATLLYLHIDYDVDGTYRLKRVPVAGGAVEVLYTFHQNPGRGGSSEDEVSVAWSPDGSLVLVANTVEGTAEFPWGSIYVFDSTGTRVLERWTGTHPRWSADGRSVYFRGHAGSDGVGLAGLDWKAMDLGTMIATKLDMRAGTNGATVSPDGRSIAYDTSAYGDMPIRTVVTGEPPNVYVYDLQTGRDELVLRGGIAARWIERRTILATNVSQAAPNPDVWGGNWWDPLGTVTRIDLDGTRSPAGMSSTLEDAAVLLGT